MGFSSWFNKRSVRTQLLMGLIGITAFVFIIAIPVYVGLAKDTENRLIDGSRDILRDDVISKMTAILGEKVDTLVNLINQNEEGFLNVIGNTVKYTTKAGGTSIFPVESYPDHLVTDLKPPVAVNLRSGGNPVSLSASSVYFVDQLPDGSNIDTLFDTNEALINDTSLIDTSCILLFQKYTDVAAVYYGDDTTGLFRRYPGMSTLNLDPNRNYDPRLRPWYTKAISIDDKISITDPYLDAFGLGWMITISFKVLDFDGNIKGVVGLDMLIDTIQANIVDFQLEDSVSYLIQTNDNSNNDIVVSAPEWNPTLAIGTVFRVNDITLGPISSVWTDIKTRRNGNTLDTGFIIIFKEVDIGDQAYIYVTAVPESTALAVVLEHEDDLKRDIDQLILLDIGLLLGSMLFVIILMLLVANWLSQPLVRSSELADKAGKSVVLGNTLSGLNAELSAAMQNGGSNEAGQMHRAMATAFSNMANETNTMPAPVGLPTYEEVTAGSVKPTAPPAINPQFKSLPDEHITETSI